MDAQGASALVGPTGGRAYHWADVHDAGTVLSSGYKLRISSNRGVMPDVQFFKTGRLPADEQQGLVNGRPDLAVEVMSPSSKTFDRVTKLNWYAQKGVPEYWLVDPERRTLERFVLRDGQYFVEPRADEAVFEPETSSGIEVPLAKLWAGPKTA